MERRHRGALTSREPCPLSGGCIPPEVRSEAALDREQGRTELVMSHCPGGTKMGEPKGCIRSGSSGCGGIVLKVEKGKTFEAEVQRPQWGCTVFYLVLVVHAPFCIFASSSTRAPPQPDHFNILPLTRPWFRNWSSHTLLEDQHRKDTSGTPKLAAEPKAWCSRPGWPSRGSPSVGPWDARTCSGGSNLKETRPTLATMTRRPRAHQGTTKKIRVSTKEEEAR